jgi:2-polyprenyl-3-methyl-5-hydroxy-6-metoxy-1,4-benzoquinol methylase
MAVGADRNLRDLVGSELLIQRDQPPGVPPLVLTGERTLPDVPAENYWYRRHLAVYEWICSCVTGLRVIDMACGEGYGANLLASRAASVIGVEANPEAYEHARLRYQRRNLRFERATIEAFAAPVDVIVLSQTIEHLADPAAVLTRFATLLGPAGVVFVSTPNLLSIAAPGAAKSDNPWHLREYRAQEFAELCAGIFASVELYGVYHARKLALHSFALRLGWDALHPRLRLTRAFYDRFIPAISTSDFLIARGPLERALDFVAVLRR